MRFSAGLSISVLLHSFVSTSTLGVWAQSVPFTKCGEVFNSTAYYLDARDVYECLVSVPFNATLATALVTYWRETFEFQSTLAYLKDPPPAYQQPSLDLLGGLDLIQDQVDNGVFSNQYSFEAAVHSLLQRAHDFHISITGGILDVFAFTQNHFLASISSDGYSLPRVYDAYELVLYRAGNITHVPSPIKSIGGMQAEKFLTKYASRNSYGALEPHGDFNHVMFSFAAAIQGYNDAFSTPFFSGDSVLVEYDNGTSIDVSWKAVYIGPDDFPLIYNAQDFYDFFLLGLDTPSDIAVNGPLPTAAASASGTATATQSGDSSVSATATATTVPYTGWGGAYPDVADITQPDLGFGGVITGYYLKDSKIGVLSIPSFTTNQDVESVSDWTATVRGFLQGAKDAGMEKILIDLQSNYGGQQLLARETFRQFFPDIDQFEGMRTRSFDTADELGNTLTPYFIRNNETLDDVTRYSLLNDPWAISTEINAGTRQNFTSWAEYYGPHPDRDDAFSTVYRHNFSNVDFALLAGGVDITNDSTSASALYDARDIVMLTDSICASTCDLFMEMMHHEAGVRTVVAGGLPQVGPMQARGALRGAQALFNYQVDASIAYASTLNQSIAHLMLNRRKDVARIADVGFNYADQIREHEYVPLQFTYEAADCRIFYTMDTFFDYEKLWEYAASAVFFNASTCVARSAEHNNTMQTDIYGPSDEQLASWAATNPAHARPNQTVVLSETSDQITFYIGFNKDDLVLSPKKVNGDCPTFPCGSSFSRGRKNAQNARRVERVATPNTGRFDQVNYVGAARNYQPPFIGGRG